MSLTRGRERGGATEWDLDWYLDNWLNDKNTWHIAHVILSTRGTEIAPIFQLMRRQRIERDEFMNISIDFGLFINKCQQDGQGRKRRLPVLEGWSNLIGCISEPHRHFTAYLSFPLSLHIYQIAQGKAWHSIWNCNGFVFFVAKRTTRNVEFFCVKLKTRNHNLDHPHRRKHTKKMTFIN